MERVFLHLPNTDKKPIVLVMSSISSFIGLTMNKVKIGKVVHIKLLRSRRLITFYFQKPYYMFEFPSNSSKLG